MQDTTDKRGPMTLSIVQTNQGSTGAADASSVTVSLPSAPTVGNGLLLIMGKTVVSSTEPPSPPWIFDGPDAGFGVTNAPHLIGFGAAVGDGTASWSVPLGATCGAAWLLAEVSGLLLSDGAFSLVPDSSVLAVNASGTAGTILQTTDSGQTAQYSNNLLLAGFAARTSSGTPPLQSSVVDDPHNQEGSWSRLGVTVATTKTSGPNVRLDVWRKFAAGVDVYGAKSTWSAAVLGRAAAVFGYRSA